MNILITGANGQLGNEMRVLSKENGQHAYFFTDVQELDICDEQAVHRFVKGNRIDVIVNCAAYTAVDKAEDNQELCDKLNHVAPGYLAAAAEACVLLDTSVHRLCFRRNRTHSLYGRGGHLPQFGIWLY